MSTRFAPTPTNGLALDYEVVEARRLHAQGVRAAEIGARLGWSPRTVYRYLGPDRYRCAHCGATFATLTLAWEHGLERTGKVAAA